MFCCKGGKKQPFVSKKKKKYFLGGGKRTARLKSGLSLKMTPRCIIRSHDSKTEHFNRQAFQDYQFNYIVKVRK